MTQPFGGEGSSKTWLWPRRVWGSRGAAGRPAPGAPGGGRKRSRRLQAPTALGNLKKERVVPVGNAFLGRPD